MFGLTKVGADTEGTEECEKCGFSGFLTCSLAIKFKEVDGPVSILIYTGET